jgi:hypothetical protein
MLLRSRLSWKRCDTGLRGNAGRQRHRPALKFHSRYCLSETFSIQSTALPSLTLLIAM